MIWQLVIFLPFFALFCSLSLNQFPLLVAGITNKISIFSAVLLACGCWFLPKATSLRVFALLPISSGLEFAWLGVENQKFFLMLIAGFWLVMEVYCYQYFLQNEDKNWQNLQNKQQINQFQRFFLAAIGLIMTLSLSHNLLAALLCYQFLILTLAFFLSSFVGQFALVETKKSAKNFTFYTLISAAFLPLAVTLTFKLSGNLDLINQGLSLAGDSYWKCLVVLILYGFGLISFAFCPIYLLFSKLYKVKAPVITVILLCFALGLLIISFKLIFIFFGQKLLMDLLETFDQEYSIITIIFAINWLISGLLLLFSKNLKNIIIFLFFNQLIFLLIKFLHFSLSEQQAKISIAAFIISQSLIFLSFNNINLYLKSAKDKSLNGIFYKLKYNVCLLIFALLSLCGIVPSAGMLEQYWLLGLAIDNQSVVQFAILLGNLSLSLLLLLKIIYPMIEILHKNRNFADDLAVNIERKWGLILPMLLLVLASLVIILRFW